MNKPVEIGKTALFFDREKVPHTTRVMVVAKLEEDLYAVVDYDDPSKTYTTGTWNFTMEKEADQPTEDELQKYHNAYVKANGEI